MASQAVVQSSGNAGNAVTPNIFFWEPFPQIISGHGNGDTVAFHQIVLQRKYDHRSVLFSLKCIRNRLEAGLRPDPLGMVKRFLRPLAVLGGGAGGEREEWVGRERNGYREGMGSKRRGREGRGGKRTTEGSLAPNLPLHYCSRGII